MSTLNEWIDDYCEENEIELPSGIPDEKTALCFLCLNKSEGGGGGGSSEKVIALEETYDEETYMVSLPLTWQEVKDNFDNKICMIVYNDGWDSSYPYHDFITQVTDDGHGTYYVNTNAGMSYEALDVNDYPSYED